MSFVQEKCLILPNYELFINGLKEMLAKVFHCYKKGACDFDLYVFDVFHHIKADKWSQ